MTEESFTEEVGREMLKEIQSWWEIPAMAQYISLFREPFNLPEIEIEELEKGFVDDSCNGPSTWLQNLVIAFLRSIMPSRINLENWEIQLRKLLKRKWPKDEPNPFEEDKSFYELTVRSKVVIVYSLCLYRLDRNDIVELMKSMDAEALRVQKLGVDSAGNTYWYFYGTRLYKEEAGKRKSWDEEWKQQKKNSFKKRGRGRPRKRPLPTSDGESDDVDDFDFNKKEGYMNVSSKSRWSVVCDTIEEWVNFAEKFKDSKSKEEISLFKIVQENFLPTLNKIYEEKEKKFQQKIRELMPAREKIVTRRETRRMRGEDVDHSPANGYSSDEVQRYYPIKDRAQRLEERNKRASEAGDARVFSRKKKSDVSTDEFNPFDPGSEGKEIDLQSQMEKLLTSVKLHKDAWPFLFPVNEEDAPGYYEIIKEPIDLSLIESRLYDGDYETVGDLDADFSKMVSNCELYNGEFHAYSKMVQMLRIIFRKGVASILDAMQPSENTVDDSDGSSDSQYHSNSNSESSPLEFPVVSPKVHKKSKEKRKKRKHSYEALDLLAAASDLAVQNSNSNDMINVSNMYDELKQSSVTNLKILPIHSHPSSVIEKISSGSVERATVNDTNSFLNHNGDINGHYMRSSPTNSTASTSSDSASYMNNLTSQHFSNFLEKNGATKLKASSDKSVSSGCSSDHESNISNSVNGSPNFPKGPVTSDNMSGLDNILDEYNENLMSHLMKQNIYNSDNQLVSQSKDNNSLYVDSASRQDIRFNKNMRKSPPTSNFGHTVADVNIMQDNSNNLKDDLGSPLNITTVDTSALGITFNSFLKNNGNSNVPATQPQDNQTMVSNLSQEGVLSRNIHSHKLKPRTSPNQFSQYYESPNISNCNQDLNAPNNMSYPNLNLGFSNYNLNVPTTCIQPFANNSTSTLPLQIPAVYPKSVQQKSRIQMQQQTSPVQVPVSQPNIMFVPNLHGNLSTMAYHLFNQNKSNPNGIEHMNELSNGYSSAENRTINTQDNYVNSNSPPSKKSPVPPEPQQPAASTHVPLPSMPYIPASTSHSNISKPGAKPISSPSNNFVQELRKEKSVIVKNKPQQIVKRKPTENVTPTSLNVASSTNTNNVVSPNNVYQTFNSKTVPVVFSYNNASPSTQSDLQFKSNSGAVATAQSIPNSLPVVQQVILPSGQQLQIQNGGQFLYASPPNAGGLFNKEQNLQFINARQVNQGFGKMVPQFITSTPVLQVSKDVMQGLQFQTVSQNNNQAYTQVTQSPQFINVPTYLLANQNAITESPQQSGINHYQLPQRQMHIVGQGNQ